MNGQQGSRGAVGSRARGISADPRLWGVGKPRAPVSAPVLLSHATSGDLSLPHLESEDRDSPSGGHWYCVVKMCYSTDLSGYRWASSWAGPTDEGAGAVGQGHT